MLVIFLALQEVSSLSCPKSAKVCPFYSNRAHALPFETMFYIRQKLNKLLIFASLIVKISPAFFFFFSFFFYEWSSDSFQSLYPIRRRFSDYERVFLLSRMLPFVSHTTLYFKSFNSNVFTTFKSAK